MKRKRDKLKKQTILRVNYWLQLRGWVKQLKGIKSNYDEHGIMYRIVESLYLIPEINIIFKTWKQITKQNKTKSEQKNSWEKNSRNKNLKNSEIHASSDFLNNCIKEHYFSKIKHISKNLRPVLLDLNNINSPHIKLNISHFYYYFLIPFFV